MDRIYQANASDTPTPAPSPGSNGFVQSDVPPPLQLVDLPTTPGPFFYYWVTESFRYVIVAVGLVPDPLNLHQLRDAVFALKSNADPYFANVVLLLHGNGLDGGTTFTDSSSFSQTVTGFGTAQTSTDQSKFGGSSLYLFSDGAYLDASNNSLNLEGGDYTIEAWVYMQPDVEFTGLAMIYSSYVDQSHGRTNLCVSAAGALIVSEQDHDGTGLSQAQSADGALSFETWHFCTATKSGTTLYLFLDGLLVASVASPVRSNWAGSGRIGRHAEGGFNDAFYGYIDDLRITRGIARYTANFTPPARQFPDRGPA